MTTEEKQPDVPLTEGEILAGKYRVERILGRGGMGVVVAAQHIHLRQRVAIKFLLPDATGEVVARFLREARAAVRLKSEHVTRVLDVGEMPGGAPFMVMEYLEGSDLSRVVRKRGALPVEEAVDYLLQACEAIAEAHSLGIVHRDLKPANLFLTKGADGSDIVKVLDFGISKDSGQAGEGEEEMQLTRTTAVLGSPYYMAPEQMRSTRSVDARADIWSLGIILYQLLTKKVPFKADSFVELALMVVNEEPKPPSSLRPEIPPGLEAVVLRTMRKKPDERYLNVAEFAAALAPFGPLTAITSAERIARVQGAPVPSIQHYERASSVSVPPPASTTHPPQSVAASSVGPNSGSTGSAVLSSGPTIPGVAQITQPSPTAAPTLPPQTSTHGTSSAGAPTSATGAAWTGSPTTQSRRTGALIIGVGVAVGALAVIGTVALTRGHSDGSPPRVATAAAPEAPQSAPAPSAKVDVQVASAAPVTPPPASASASAAPIAPIAPVGTARGSVPSITGRTTATAAVAAPPPPVTAAPAPPPPPPVTAAPAPPPPPPVTAAPAPPPKKNVLDIDIK